MCLQKHFIFGKLLLLTVQIALCIRVLR